MNLTDHDTERALLGAFMLHPERIADAVRDWLVPCSFAAPGHAIVFAAMVKLGADPILARPCSAVAEELTRAGHLRLVGGPAALATMLDDALPINMLRPACERLPMLASARKVQAALREAHAIVVRDPARAREVLATIGGRA